MPPVQYIMTSVVAGSTSRSAAGTARWPWPSRGVSAKLSCIKESAGERLGMAGYAARPLDLDTSTQPDGHGNGGRMSAELCISPAASQPSNLCSCGSEAYQHSKP